MITFRSLLAVAAAASASASSSSVPKIPIFLLVVRSTGGVAFAGVGATADSSSTSSSRIDYPPKLDSDDVAYFSETYDVDGLHEALKNVFLRSERNPDETQIVHKLPSTIISRGGGSTYTTEYKLKLDLEQSEYLSSVLDDEEEAKFFGTEVSNAYRKVLGSIPPLDMLERTGGLYPFRKSDLEETGIGRYYNKAWHVTDFDELKDERGNPAKMLSESFDPDAIQRRWFGEEEGSATPGVVVVDDVLSPAALSRIRRLLLESTVWYQTKMPLKFGGYAGAYIDDGLHDRILLCLAFELHKSLPRIMAGHPLKYLWAYKYDSEHTGINTHADQAAVNVNLWITPDDANLDPTSGGLVIYTAKPPEDWDFDAYNTDTEKVMEELIKPTGYANVTVPHKQNRAVLFDSALFHHTDKFKFKRGYENRRINLTILYGDMKRGGGATETTTETRTGGDSGGDIGAGAKEDL